MCDGPGRAAPSLQTDAGAERLPVACSVLTAAAGGVGAPRHQAQPWGPPACILPGAPGMRPLLPAESSRCPSPPVASHSQYTHALTTHALILTHHTHSHPRRMHSPHTCTLTRTHTPHTLHSHTPHTHALIHARAHPCSHHTHARTRAHACTCTPMHSPHTHSTHTLHMQRAFSEGPRGRGFFRCQKVL